MKLGSHEVEPIPFPGNDLGYLPGPSGKPGDVVGFFPVGPQVYQCVKCMEMFQPVQEDRCSAPEDPQTAPRIRVPWGGLSMEMLDTLPNWVCEGSSLEEAG